MGLRRALRAFLRAELSRITALNVAFHRTVCPLNHLLPDNAVCINFIITGDGRASTRLVSFSFFSTLLGRGPTLKLKFEHEVHRGELLAMAWCVDKSRPSPIPELSIGAKKTVLRISLAERIAQWVERRRLFVSSARISQKSWNNGSF
ncbi:hypothetical protein BM221_005109 [Beauveria bassiana]|uniref:Uncharacterized protein n=1 Tax=Beauveria bassiana TaxID=176275 RepID=A0A2N6NMN1_BEABA|nr:hypothetical protein BM221_005109 [Beauveria bassiana]